jgi:hypothetical protein
MNDYTLYHHGILGQKWGKKNGPPYPLGVSDHSSSEKKAGWRKSLTNTENRQYNVDIETAKNNVKKAKADYKKTYRAYNKNTLGGAIYNKKEIKKVNQAAKQEEYAKEDLKSEKVKSKLNNEKAISQRRVNLEQYYQNKGMTDEEAAIAAYKREKTEKIVAAAATLTVVAAASYVAYKHYDQTVDKIIPQDTVLKRISTNGDQSVKDAFYAVIGKENEQKHIGLSDERKYAGLYGWRLSAVGNNVFQKSIKVDNGLKVASEKSATKSLQNLVNQDASYVKKMKDTLDFKRDFMCKLNSTPKQRATVDKALKSLSKGKIDTNVYEAINYQLADHDSEITKGFYKQLISDGYDAIIDVNDKKLSGYMANKPVIVFNSKNVTVEKVRQIGAEEIQKEYINGMMDISFKQLVSKAAVATGAVAGTKAILDVSKNKKNDAIVAKYRKEHPDTQLSCTEIVRNQS